MKKTKVLLVAYNNLGKGGIQNQLMGIIRSLKDKTDFDIVVWDDVKDYYSPELNQYGIKIIHCFRDIGNSIFRKKIDAFIRYRDIRNRIDSVIQKYGPYDAIHCNNAYDSAPCLEAAKKAGIPVRISHAHNTENPNLRKKLTYPAYRILYAHNRRKIHRYATHMIGCSQQVTDYFFGKGFGQVIHVGIDLFDFQNSVPSLKNEKTIDLLHVGNMSEQKNQLFLVDIMEELVKLRNNIHLTMIGSGSTYLSLVNRRIKEKCLERFITILPPETNIPQIMTTAKLFVFPSTFEGFGIVLIEAQAAGLYCMVSDVISPEADCGGLRYLSLNKGSTYWAEQIARAIDIDTSPCAIFNVSEFDVRKMSSRIYSIYKQTDRYQESE